MSGNFMVDDNGMLPEKLTELRNKLSYLRQVDGERKTFGSSKPSGHDFQFQPLSSKQIKKLEKKLTTSLPIEFRNFLSVIGYGAGPGYGILSPKKMLYEYIYCNSKNAF